MLRFQTWPDIWVLLYWLIDLPPLSLQPKTAAGLRRFGSLASFFAPLLVIFALWLSVVRAYHIPGIKISNEMLQQGRDSPPDAVLDELKDFDFLQDRWQGKPELMAAASALLGGQLRFESCSAHVNLPFSAAELEQIPAPCDLPLAGFFVPDVFLRAYESSGREEFLSAAQAFILGAHEYEEKAWLPRGQFWNDHAISARVSVLANFWRLYRHSPSYRPDVARQVMSMAARSEALLTKPGLFTVATNHGIMQNLALWHASLAFPALPDTQEYQRLALARMNDQMKFYVSEEGVILEHSAGYQPFGLERLAWAFRYLDLMHQPVPQEWIDKYERAQKFYVTLRRPDGSLPMFGDTDAAADQSGPPVASFAPDRRARRLFYQDWKPTEAVNLYPVSGCSIWWDGLDSWPQFRDLSQTVVTWSNFAGHGHKHADEMSVLFWAGGQNWWSNIGYWPYESQWRSTIESWPGSNAPHLLGESSTASRTTRLMATGASDILTALDLERTGVDHYTARRQVVHWKPDFWLVLDSSSGNPGSRTTTIWTTSPDIRWQQGAEGAFVLEDNRDDQRLNGFVLGSPGTEQKLFRGSTDPFVGWQVEGGTGVPASALVIEQPAPNSWTAMLWRWQKSGDSATAGGPPQMINWTDASNWQMRLPANGIALQRRGNVLELHPDKGWDTILELKSPPEVAPQLAELDRQFAASAAKYPRFFERTATRVKVTWLLLGIFVLQEVFFLLYKRIRGADIHSLRVLNALVWIAGGIWLMGFYF